MWMKEVKLREKDGEKKLPWRIDESDKILQVVDRLESGGSRGTEAPFLHTFLSRIAKAFK